MADVKDRLMKLYELHVHIERLQEQLEICRERRAALKAHYRQEDGLNEPAVVEWLGTRWLVPGLPPGMER